jgi:hypothetical protein
MKAGIQCFAQQQRTVCQGGAVILHSPLPPYSIIGATTNETVIHSPSTLLLSCSPSLRTVLEGHIVSHCILPGLSIKMTERVLEPLIKHAEFELFIW